MKSKKLILIIIIFILLIVFSIIVINNKNNNKQKNLTYDKYVKGESSEVVLYDLEYNESIKVIRGTSITCYKMEEMVDNILYVKIKYKDNFYMIKKENIADSLDDLITESEMYVRTSLTLYEDLSSSKILSSIKKGERLEIIGYDKLDENGIVNKYKVKYNTMEGYVYAKYLVSTKEESLLKYSENGIQEYMESMGDYLGSGSATTLDYYPVEKVSFKDNIMPEEVRAIYINSSAVSNIDEYIEFAKNNNINAFVIDIKDNTSPAYDSSVMKSYSPTNANYALNTYEDYKNYIKKAKDAGLYLIGRITTFKDSYFVSDHSEVAITNSSGEAFSHNGSYWPSAYNRYVWEFNVELGKEAITEIGFNEIQFDYVRFPDRTTSLEQNGIINLNNTYNETKSEAIQNFVMYACDEIHSVGGYVSIDVFGESASNYVTAYGQFWASISNVADVISAMPYPDHFNEHEYGISEVVWTVPYKLLDAWSKYVISKQEIIPTPAKVRTWIQAYNTSKSPSVVYDSNKVSEEIKALYDNGLNSGYMTWNSSSNLVKYKEISDSFKEVY